MSKKIEVNEAGETFEQFRARMIQGEQNPPVAQAIEFDNENLGADDLFRAQLAGI